MKRTSLKMVLISGFIILAMAGGLMAKETPKTLVIASGNSGGTYYYIAAGQAKILTDSLEIPVTTESTSGSPVENSVFVQEDVGTLGLVTLDGLYAGIEGDKSRGFMEALKDLTMVQAGHSILLYCVTLQDSGIESFSDLKDKRISLPTVGNTAYFQAVEILKAYDVSLNDCRATPMMYSEATDALKDGTLDAIFVAGGIPQAAVTELNTTKDIRLLTIDPEKAETLVKANPFWTIYKIPSGTYSDCQYDVNVFAATVLLLANINLDDDLVYNITKTLNEKVDELTAIHSSGAEYNIEHTKEIINMNIVPLHPGAAKYYNEVS